MSAPLELNSLIQLVNAAKAEQRARNLSKPVVLDPATRIDLYPALKESQRSFDLDKYKTDRQEYINTLLEVVRQARVELGMPNSQEPEIVLGSAIPSAPPFPRITPSAPVMSIEKQRAIEKLRNELPTLPELALHELYDDLSKYETVILVDKNRTNSRSTAYLSDSGRTQTCDQKINATVEKLIRIMGCIDPSGVDVIVSNSGSIHTETDVKDLTSRSEITRRIKQWGGGRDNLQNAIGHLNSLYDRSPTRPFHTFIVTGGGWDNTQETIGAINNHALNEGILKEGRIINGETVLNKFQVVHHCMNEAETYAINALDNADDDNPVAGILDATADYEQERPEFQIAFDRKRVNYGGPQCLDH